MWMGNFEDAQIVELLKLTNYVFYGKELRTDNQDSI